MATRLTSVSDEQLLDETANLEEMQSAAALNEMRRLATVLALRRIEGLRLYEPMPVQALFHLSRARERLLRGSNQGGKTLPASVEVARAVTGQDASGKYPKRDGLCYAVGFDGKHIADPMWRKLSKAGAFRIIRDLSTLQWRAYRPWILEDAMRADETKPAPPLIPPRLIEDIAWEEKKTNQPQMVKLVGGWELHFYSGNAKPPQGSQIDLAWFDEELADSEWYPEIAARLLYKRGYFIWSATPQAGTDRLFELHERAERQVEDNVNPRTVEEFEILLDNNVHMTVEQKNEWKAKLNDDDADIRIGGQFGRIHRVFPEYNSKFHEIEFRPIPLDWTRYVAIDPGWQVCACLFLAVPPPTHPDHGQFFLYDELYLRECDAAKFGAGMAKKCNGQDFQEFIIDSHEALKHTATGKTTEQYYREALQKNGVRCQSTGHGFSYGDTDVDSGLEGIRGWLRKSVTAETHTADHRIRVMVSPLRVIRERCPMFIWEIRRYKLKSIKGAVTNQPIQKNNHTIDCLRYLVQRQPVWVQRSRRTDDPPAWAAFQKFLKSTNQKPAGGMMLGPGSR